MWHSPLFAVRFVQPGSGDDRDGTVGLGHLHDLLEEKVAKVGQEPRL